uniref:MIF4G domain-containing protein n=1 Tax=viral metagenome TaxID=1070528 RepID=A0A6C0HYI1_9ZZZZ
MSIVTIPKSIPIIHYSLNDFNELLFSESFSYSLDNETIKNIENLAQILGISLNSSVSTMSNSNYDYPVRKPRINANRSSSNNIGRKVLEESWLQPVFKTTVIEKKEGTMPEIHTCLNKLSEKNYDNNKTILLELIRKEDISNLPEIANNIFDIASTNKFFSEIYAKLYKELLTEFDIFDNILQTFLTNFCDTMRNIVYVDPTKNYDDFCAYNKKNDSRKATSMFITNLVKKEVLSVETLANIIIQIQTIMKEYMETANRTNEVEEITENLFLLITPNSALLKTWALDQWNDLLANIQIISQCKAKDHASLTSRAIFKHLDMLDSFQNVKK